MSLQIDISGKIVKGYPLDQREYKGKIYSEKAIQVTTGGEYPEDFKILFKGDNIDKMKGFVKDGKLNTSDTFLFKCNLRSRKWTNTKGEDLFFPEFICWSFELTQGSIKTPETISVSDLEEGDDLPF